MLNTINAQEENPATSCQRTHESSVACPHPAPAPPALGSWLPIGQEKTHAGWRLKPPRGAPPSAEKPGMSTARSQQREGGTHGNKARAVKKRADAMKVRQPHHSSKPYVAAAVPCKTKQARNSATNRKNTTAARRSLAQPRSKLVQNDGGARGPTNTTRQPPTPQRRCPTHPATKRRATQRAGHCGTATASCSPGSPTTVEALGGDEMAPGRHPGLHDAERNSTKLSPSTMCGKNENRQPGPR